MDILGGDGKVAHYVRPKRMGKQDQWRGLSLLEEEEEEDGKCSWSNDGQSCTSDLLRSGLKLFELGEQ